MRRTSARRRGLGLVVLERRGELRSRVGYSLSYDAMMKTDKVTVPGILASKGKRKLAMLTAYDATMARLLDEGGADMLLIGDSLGMVVQGHTSTLPVTLSSTM